MQKLPLFSSKGDPFLDTMSEILSDLFVSLCTLIASFCHALSRGFLANHKRVSKALETFHFLVHRYLKTERCIRLKFLVRRKLLFMLRIRE